MTSFTGKIEETLKGNGPEAATKAVELVESGVADGASSICRSALLILAVCDDSDLLTRLGRALSKFRAGSIGDYLLDLCIALCDVKSPRVEVNVQRLFERFPKGSGGFPAIFQVWRGMEFFNQGKSQDALKAFSSVYRSTGDLWVRDLLMKTYLRSAYSHIAKRRYSEALTVLSEAVKVDGTNLEALQSLAILRTTEGTSASLLEMERSWARTVDILRALHKAFPEDGYGEKILSKHKYFATQFLRAGSWTLAKSELASIIELEPENSLAKEILASFTD
ncbi:hypothetical protein J7M28_04695 [bacterium]|nr:hypothetical protein [bacterium]